MAHHLLRLPFPSAFKPLLPARLPHPTHPLRLPRLPATSAGRIGTSSRERGIACRPPLFTQQAAFFARAFQRKRVALPTVALGTIAEKTTSGGMSRKVEVNLEYTIGYPTEDDQFAPRTLAFIGHKETLLSESILAMVPTALVPLYEVMVKNTSGGQSGGSTSSWLPDGLKLLVGILPSACSRHNCPAQPHVVTNLVKAIDTKDDVAIILGLADPEHAVAAACACARAFPLFSMKTSSEESVDTPTVRVGLSPIATSIDWSTLVRATQAAQGVRTAAKIVDAPPQEMTTTQFIKEAQTVADRHPAVSIKIVAGTELQELGFGGIWGVGKAAEEPPAFVVLSYVPDEFASSEDAKTVALVGKGIVYDTGGLSIKVGGNMCSMKSDCGGAAAMLAAFDAAVAGHTPHSLHCCLCLAENAIGRAAFRNDDILTLYSGKTVEINNTDAEGRLVLGDGVAYACKEIKPDVIIDMATLTGAQMIATGKRHAGIVANTEELEQLAVQAGRASGDLAHPLPFCPEFYTQEFKSEVADMKNSVKDRSNAQSSCAATFIYNHLDPEYKGGWLHCDIAGPSVSDERGTGFGVALLLDVLNKL